MQIGACTERAFHCCKANCGAKSRSGRVEHLFAAIPHLQAIATSIFPGKEAVHEALYQSLKAAFLLQMAYLNQRDAIVT